ncbi:MAG TPA: HAD-IC family P-type ATPase [Casimicrobiaceae bacterium]
MHAQATGDALGRAGKTALFLALNGTAVGIVAVADVIRDEVPAAIEAMKHMGVRRLILLTGDNERVAAAIASRLGITEYHANLLPQDKITVVQALQRAGHTVAMIGDGVNDVPALAQADVGIAMGVVGSDVALEVAHVALMRDDWSQVSAALRMGRSTYRVIRQNIVLGIAWDVVTMGLASIGILTPVLAAATEALPDVLVSLNSARLLKAPGMPRSRISGTQVSRNLSSIQ